MRRDRIPGAMLTFAIGAGVGAAAALLLAPKSGEDLRGDIADGVNGGIDRVRTAGKDVKRRAQRVVDIAKDQVQDVIDAGEAAYEHARKV